LTAYPSKVADGETVAAKLTLLEDGTEQSVSIPLSLSLGCGFNCGDSGTAVPLLFIRGDATGEGAIDISDGILVFNYLFLGGRPPGCLQAADANASENVDISDGIYVLNYLFMGGPEPPAPFPGCGVTPQGSGLPCAFFPGCP
jgi:hypothetical protein